MKFLIIVALCFGAVLAEYVEQDNLQALHFNKHQATVQEAKAQLPAYVADEQLEQVGAYGNGFGASAATAADDVSVVDNSVNFGAENSAAASFGAESNVAVENSAASSFGAQNSAAYEAQNAASFGAQNSAAYEAQNAASFGAQNSAAFDAQNSAASSFGAQNSAASSFGAQNSAASNFGAQSSFGSGYSSSYGASHAASLGAHSASDYVQHASVQQAPVLVVPGGQSSVVANKQVHYNDFNTRRVVVPVVQFVPSTFESHRDVESLAISKNTAPVYPSVPVVGLLNSNANANFNAGASFNAASTSNVHQLMSEAERVAAESVGAGSTVSTGSFGLGLGQIVGLGASSSAQSSFNAQNSAAFQAAAAQNSAAAYQLANAHNAAFQATRNSALQSSQAQRVAFEANNAASLAAQNSALFNARGQNSALFNANANLNSGASAYLAGSNAGLANSHYRTKSWEKAHKYQSQSEWGSDGKVKSFNSFSTGEGEQHNINGKQFGYNAATSTVDNNGQISQYSLHS